MKEKIHYNEQEMSYICKKEFDNNDKKHYKVRDHCHYTGKYRGAAHNICNLRYKVPREIPVVFHNGSIYVYHFIIKELVKEFDGNFECLDENTEKYIFSAPVKKKNENKDIEITYKKSPSIVIDLCHHRYRNSLIIYQKDFIIINIEIFNLVSII